MVQRQRATWVWELPHQSSHRADCGPHHRACSEPRALLVHPGLTSSGQGNLRSPEPACPWHSTRRSISAMRVGRLSRPSSSPYREFVTNDKNRKTGGGVRRGYTGVMNAQTSLCLLWSSGGLVKEPNVVILEGFLELFCQSLHGCCPFLVVLIFYKYHIGKTF